MGKNRIIQSLGKVIGNVVVHKIILKYGNKMESKNRLSYEIISYRDNAIGISHEFNWNDSDKDRVKEEALNEFNNRIKKYPDVIFPASEIDKFLDETIKECLE